MSDRPTPTELDMMVQAVRDQLAADDAARPEIRHDIEHLPESIPADVWKGALLYCVRNVRQLRLELEMAPVQHPGRRQARRTIERELGEQQ